MSRTVEEWRPIQGYEGLYEVSDWGNVRSVDRTFEYMNQGKMIRRTFKGIVLRKVLNEDGYHKVSLRDRNHKGHEGKVHRLVAQAFIPNLENKKEVGHLKTMENGLEDKTANEAWNLQWMSREENANYGTIGERIAKHMRENNPMKREEVAKKVALKQRIIGKKKFEEHPELYEAFQNSDKHNEKKKIKVNQYNLTTGELIRTWDSAADIERELGIDHSNVAANCKGKVKSAGGFKFKYA